VRLFPPSLVPDVVVLRGGVHWLFSQHVSVPFTNFDARTIESIEWKVCVAFVSRKLW
jgi:hypothetical protein